MLDASGEGGPRKISRAVARLRAAGRWPAATYARYCRLLARWAQEATAYQDREVWPDELEHWLFTGV